MTPFELNKTYKDGYGNEMLVIYINPNPDIKYPLVAVDKYGTTRSYQPDGRHSINPDSPLNLIPPTLTPRSGEIWSSEGTPYHIFKSPETGSLMAINIEYFTLFVLDESLGRLLNLDTRHVQ